MYTQNVEQPNHRIIYLPADADSDTVYQAPPASSSDYYEQTPSGKTQESSSEQTQDPHSSIYHKISEVSSENNRPIGKDLSVYRHQNRGTVIDIPAASEQMLTFLRPDVDEYNMMETYPYEQYGTHEIELSKITTINKSIIFNQKIYYQNSIDNMTKLRARRRQQ
ncbi:hypothetical protein BLA29_006732 [Euroglyphus maynei]|uniref:Uncharacterized protein n=1 Tax=Euroglyphus maynei TaxID=6958 RepID=A0A1Y3BXY0_EURMA|nr:hypothetical protein BLA29_006732 [Euroglyphus maynei]